MTVTLFVTILSACATASGFLTEAIKKAYDNAKKPYSANVIALINSLITGCGGTAVVYLLTNAPWTVNNIICLCLMGICSWVGSMIGYDKITQLVQQIAVVKEEKGKN